MSYVDHQFEEGSLADIAKVYEQNKDDITRRSYAHLNQAAHDGSGCQWLIEGSMMLIGPDMSEYGNLASALQRAGAAAGTVSPEIRDPEGEPRLVLRFDGGASQNTVESFLAGFALDSPASAVPMTVECT